jgi:hypothetical protein
MEWDDNDVKGHARHTYQVKISKFNIQLLGKRNDLRRENIQYVFNGQPDICSQSITQGSFNLMPVEPLCPETSWTQLCNLAVTLESTDATQLLLAFSGATIVKTCVIHEKLLQQSCRSKVYSIRLNVGHCGLIGAVAKPSAA